MHCDNASCVRIAQDGAIYRRPDGIVIIDPVKAAGHVGGCHVLGQMRGSDFCCERDQRIVLHLGVQHGLAIRAERIRGRQHLTGGQDRASGLHVGPRRAAKLRAGNDRVASGSRRVVGLRVAGVVGDALFAELLGHVQFERFRLGVRGRDGFRGPARVYILGVHLVRHRVERGDAKLLAELGQHFLAVHRERHLLHDVEHVATLDGADRYAHLVDGGFVVGVGFVDHDLGLARGLD